MQILSTYIMRFYSFGTRKIWSLYVHVGYVKRSSEILYVDLVSRIFVRTIVLEAWMKASKRDEKEIAIGGDEMKLKYKIEYAIYEILYFIH